MSYRVVPPPVHYDDVRRARCIIDRYPLRRRRSRPGNWTPSRIIDNCPACLRLSVLPPPILVARRSFGKWRGMTAGYGSKGIDWQSRFFFFIHLYNGIRALLCLCVYDWNKTVPRVFRLNRWYNPQGDGVCYFPLISNAHKSHVQNGGMGRKQKFHRKPSAGFGKNHTRLSKKLL